MELSVQTSYYNKYQQKLDQLQEPFQWIWEFYHKQSFLVWIDTILSKEICHSISFFEYMCLDHIFPCLEIYYFADNLTTDMPCENQFQLMTIF